ETHAAECNKEGVFAADAIAQPSEQERAKGADQKTRSEERNRAQERCDRMCLLEELHRQHRGQAAEDVKVIPLDDIPHGGSPDHLTEILWNPRIGHLSPPCY